ncbi:MAG: cytochrome c biogenesis protein CcdA [Firmicutes bacterium]|jgi:cytochrome c-type biogenesis protein|nr:cytochrome c biogenesis protein CcdA [Bacillota bacterium]
MVGNVSYFVAFGGGIASFVSPCVLPLVPAYLSVIGGTSFQGNSSGKTPSPVSETGVSSLRVVINTLLFIFGFGVVFISIGLTATSIGHALLKSRLMLTEISGGIVLAMALFLLLTSLDIRWSFLYREARLHISPSKFGFLAAFATGVAFGFGWTPCLGPVLAAVTAVAVSQRGFGQGTALLTAYSLGIGVPFILLGLFYNRLTGAFKFLRRHSVHIMRISAFMMVFFGVLLLLNRLSLVTSFLETIMNHIGLKSLVYSG